MPLQVKANRRATKKVEEVPNLNDAKGSLSMRVEIPMWGLVCFLAGGIWFGGQFLQKVNTMVDGFTEMKAVVTALQKEQNNGAAASAALQTLTAQHEARLTAIELRERRK